MSAQKEDKEGRAGIWKAAIAVKKGPVGGRRGRQGDKRDRTSCDPSVEVPEAMTSSPIDLEEIREPTERQADGEE